MTSVIVYRLPDSEAVAVAILNPASRREGETETAFYQRMAGLYVPRNVPCVIMPEETLSLLDRDFRAAWRMDGKGIRIDMEAAREIFRDRIRLLRAPLLARLDIEYQRADELKDQDEKDSIAARKQMLRDATKHPGIDAAQGTDELKAVKWIMAGMGFDDERAADG